MYRHLLLILHVALLVLISYERNPERSSAGSSEALVVMYPPATAESEAKQKDKLISMESYVEDFRIGRSGRNKIEIQSVEKENTVITVHFYSLDKGGEWKLNQTIELKRPNYFHSLAPVFTDFNNDGLKDVTFVSADAARGANTMRTLLIYDKKRDRLVHIKNSDEYPNLEYNRKLNCIDSWAFHGATTTLFLKLEGDRLSKFAAVDTGLERTVSLIDKKGNWRIVRREKMKEEDIYTRYSNYNPPE